MDCLRSGLEDAACPGVVAALEGRPGACACELVGPKKSSPSNESPGLVCFGGAGPFGGADLVAGGSVVAGRGAGAVSSPNRSTFSGALVKFEGWLDLEGARDEDDWPIFCFSWTTLSGYEG